ncbi:DNA ligase [Bacteroidales bacterium Barb6]|nr:DNA ligase [Bacteroidales bacterium Barb6]
MKYDANVVDAISRSTNYLIVGANGGSKIDKATKLDVAIIHDQI